MLRKIMLILTLVIIAGCVSPMAKEKIHRATVINDSFVKKMDAGQTSREQEQNHIRAMRVWHYSLDYNVNGNEPPADVQVIDLESEE
jgi:uncharacterized protein YxeA